MRDDENLGGPEGLYHSLAPNGASSVHVAMRVGPAPESFAPRLCSIAAAVDPTLRLYDLLPLDEIGSAEQVQYTFFASAFAFAAFIALLLSAVGIYSLVSFTVSQRTREIGIRAALGADPRRIVTTIFSLALAQIGLGVLAGSLVAALLGYQSVRGEIGLLLAVAALMTLVGLVACGVPARRALRIQPTEALKEGG